MKRVRWLRRLFMVLAWGFLAYLISSIRPAGTRPLGGTGQVAETLVREMKGARDRLRFRDFVYDEDRAGGQGFRIQASEAIGFRDAGEEFYRLKDVLLEIKGDDPRARGLVVGAPRAEFRQGSRAMKIFDGVFVERDGISIRADRFVYEPSRRSLSSEGPVDVVQGRLIGKAKKGQLDALEGIIRLEGDVLLAGFEGEGRPVQVRAGALTLTKDGRFQASGGVVLKTTEVILRSKNFDRTIQGSDDSLLASGAASLLMIQSEAGTSVSGWAQGDEIAIVRDAAGVPSRLTLTGDTSGSRIEFGPQPGTGARECVSSRIDARLESGKVAEIILPAAFTLTESMEAEPLGDASDAGLRVLEGSSARLVMAPDGKTVRAATVTGPVRGTQGSGIAIDGSAASYQADGEVLSVSGNATNPATYRDRRGVVKANSMSFLSVEKRLKAEGSVKAAFSGAETVSFPGSDAKDPFFSESDSLEMFVIARQLVLSGSVRAWQKENVVRCAKLLLDDRNRSIRADGNVRGVFRRRGTTGPARKSLGTPDTEIVNSTSEVLIHREKDHVVRLEGKSSVASGQWKMDADVTDIHLTPERAIQYAEARGAVELDDRVTRRHGQGEKATWQPSSEVMTLEGNPAKATDGQGNRMEGAILIFRPGKSRVDVETSKGIRSEGVFRPPEGS